MVFDLAGLLRALTAGRVRFVVIGGIAVVAHRVVRATEDLDVVPDPADENLARLCEVLRGMDARLLRNPARGVDASVREALSRGRNITVTTPLGDIDVVQRLPGVPSFGALYADSQETSVFDVPFRVCSREHLISMKRARGSALDLADVEHLTQD